MTIIRARPAKGRGRHAWPTAALALALGTTNWTDDGDCLGRGVATGTTATLSQSRRRATKDDGEVSPG